MDNHLPLLLVFCLVGLLAWKQRQSRAPAPPSPVFSDDRLALAVESADLGVWEWESRNDTLSMDARARFIHGLAPDASPISYRRILECMPEEDRAPFEAAFARLSPSSPGFVVDYRIADPDGTVRHVVTRGRARFENNGGRLRQFTGVSIDITARRASSLELQQRRAELAHATRAVTVSQLTGSLAHELNQPLSAIVSNSHAGSKYLQHPAPDLPELGRILADISADALRASHIIQRLRALLRKNAFESESIELAPLITETVDLLHTDLLLKRVNLQSRDLPAGLRVRGDRVQLQQVLVNLLLNAADAMSAQHPHSRIIRVRAGLSPDGGAWIGIEDRGPGLPPERLATLFEPFNSTKPHGLGLGLSISRAIMDLHQGSIRFAPNAPGRGLTASLHFPPGHLA